MRFPLHMLFHFLVPAVVASAVLLWRRRSRLTGAHVEPLWRQIGKLWLILIATMAVDLDHLLADPIFDAGRCSLGHHPLHTWPAMLIYGLLCCIPRWRWWGVGLVIHMCLDGLDCWLMQ